MVVGRTRGDAAGTRHWLTDPTPNATRPHHPVMAEPQSVELVDFGDAARLERFGNRLVDRPSPGATEARRHPALWADADLRFDRDTGWSGPDVGVEDWRCVVDGLTLHLRPTAAGQIGLFPEHSAMLPWLRDRLVARAGRDRSGPMAVLHLFAYTGLATLAMAEAGATVTHVDASRPTVSWARRNAEASGLTSRTIRWIVDDARAFADREVRRDRVYTGIVLDPPTYGHGSGGRTFRIEADLEPLLAVCSRLLTPGGFVLLTAHTPALGPDELDAILRRAMRMLGPAVDSGTLELTTGDGRRLELGSFARAMGAA
jgi:23S rRNA (cytosine1962-C5)-methyltransferase